MRIGDCWFYLRFFFCFVFAFFCLVLFLVYEDCKAVTYVVSSAYKPVREMEVMHNYAAYSYVWGQAIIYPSMYSLNFLLYNKDYKTRNIHRWVSYTDAWPRVGTTLAVMYTRRKGYPEASLSLQAWRRPWKLLSSLSRGRNSFSPLYQRADSHPCFVPPVFLWALQTFFFMSCVSCICKSTTLVL